MTIISPAIETLFHDVDKDTASRLSASLVPHAILAFESPAPRPAWAQTAYDGKRLFLKCIQDRALPSAVQDMFVQRSGVAWIVKDVNAGHELHISQMEEVCKVIVDFVETLQES